MPEQRNRQLKLESYASSSAMHDFSSSSTLLPAQNSDAPWTTVQYNSVVNPFELGSSSTSGYAYSDENVLPPIRQTLISAAPRHMRSQSQGDQDFYNRQSYSTGASFQPSANSYTHSHHPSHSIPNQSLYGYSNAHQAPTTRRPSPYESPRPRRAISQSPYYARLSGAHVNSPSSSSRVADSMRWTPSPASDTAATQQSGGQFVGRMASSYLACFFCRGRKIACGRPMDGSLDMTCNQCSRRGIACQYPTTSRRGQHKRSKKKVGMQNMPVSLGHEVSMNGPESL
ncbi:hypothetical protein BDZ89DRAFT_1198342 [Hymenopellis radicata]|nr:hypothetical protein BDZ89DRAFT_1198342 [Hymenopellis radicata]